MDIDAGGLLKIIGELEVRNRVFSEELDIRQARIEELEQQLATMHDSTSTDEPTPIIASVTEDVGD